MIPGLAEVQRCLIYVEMYILRRSLEEMIEVATGRVVGVVVVVVGRSGVPGHPHLGVLCACGVEDVIRAVGRRRGRWPAHPLGDTPIIDACVLEGYSRQDALVAEGDGQCTWDGMISGI